MDNNNSQNLRRRARSPEPGEEPTNAPPLRDPCYYHQDGDCVIRVENVLFKIPRFLLVRGSTVFRDMFNIPLNATNAGQSLSEADPLVLQDTADDFRALCWALNASPMVIVNQRDLASVNIRRLVSVFYMAHKYQFLEHEQWACDTIINHCSYQGRNGAYLYRQRCSIFEYKRLLTLANIKEIPQLKSNVCEAWLDRLKLNTTLTSKDPLDFAENMNLRRFQGQIYYNQMLRTKPTSLENSTASSFPESDLSPAQDSRLYRGFCSLSLYWDSLRRNHRNICNSECGIHWRGMWGTRNADLPVLDPLGDLNLMIRSALSPNCSCRGKAQRIRDVLQDNLADHFLGPLV